MTELVEFSNKVSKKLGLKAKTVYDCLAFLEIKVDFVNINKVPEGLADISTKFPLSKKKRDSQQALIKAWHTVTGADFCIYEQEPAARLALIMIPDIDKEMLLDIMGALKEEGIIAMPKAKNFKGNDYRQRTKDFVNAYFRGKRDDLLAGEERQLLSTKVFQALPNAFKSLTRYQ